MAKQLTITPSVAKMLNQRIADHFESYPDEKVVAVTPDGNVFFADGDTKHGEKGLHDAKDHARKNGWDSVIMVTKDEVVQPNASEPSEIKVAKLSRSKTAEEKQAEAEAKQMKLSGEANKKTAAKEEANIIALLKGKQPAKAVAAYNALTDDVKRYLSTGTITALGVDPPAADDDQDPTPADDAVKKVKQLIKDKKTDEAVAASKQLTAEELGTLNKKEQKFLADNSPAA